MNTPESQAGGTPDSAKLNVVFHGLWAFETTKAGPIIAYTPYVEGHKFKAGTRKNNVDLVRGAEHILRNVPDQKPATFDFKRQENVVEDNKKFTDKKGDLFCKVKLYPPDEIKSVRLVHVKGEQVFGGADGQNLHPDNAAMVQVFIYNVRTPEEVSLEPAGAKPTSKNGAWNLHVFAQPGPGDDHPMNVALNHYAVMAAMFGLDIKGISAVSVPASDPHIAGLTADDLLGLDEIPKGKLRNEVSGSNCDGLVINNRESPVEVSK